MGLIYEKLGEIDKATEEMTQAINIEDQVGSINLKKHREYFEKMPRRK
jgi:hypothetical protein